MNVNPNANVIEALDAQSFEARVQHGVVLVDFSEPWCGPCHMQVPIMKRVTEFQGRQSERAWCCSAGPVLVHFRTSWCGQCQILAPSLEALAGELEAHLRIVEVNLDESPQLAERFGITQVPTLILFESGTPIECFDALTAPEELQARLQGVLADYSTPVSVC